MSLPESLPARLYLLAYDTRRERMSGRSQLGLVLRAAALTDLYLDRRLVDASGWVRVVDTGPTGDPVLDGMVQEIAGHAPRSWPRWIGRRPRQTVRAVRDRLEADLHLKVEHRAILPDRVELRDRNAVSQYLASVRAALAQPATRIEPRTAAVLALAARGELSTVLASRERRQQRRLIDELSDQTGPVADALRKAIRARKAAATSNATIAARR